MNRSHIAIAVAVLTAAAVTGCSNGAGQGTWQLTKAADSAAAPAPAAAGPSAGLLAVGPGPTNYVVQRQPAAGSCQYRHSPTGEPLPDPHCTPGAISPKVTQVSLAHTVCRAG